MPLLMLYYLVKISLSALVIVLVSEVAKRSSGFAALIASLPMTSLLAFIWLRAEGEVPLKIAELSEQIFWLIIPSLVLFPLFAGLLRYGMAFWSSLMVSIVVTAICYLAMVPILRRLGVIL